MTTLASFLRPNRHPKGSFVWVRFVIKIQEEDNGCWTWLGGVNNNGYGMYRCRAAHRWAYEAFVGPVSAELDLDHVVCRNRRCVNPLHVEPVTHAENMRRYGETVTQCVQGHEYTPENTYAGTGRKQCRECHRVWGRQRRARLRREAAA